jgi:hypothetical protein
VTIVPSGAPGTPANPEDLETGLEDFDFSTDAVMPRLSIVHAEGVFEDNLSGQKYGELTVILLGLVKQRVLWAGEVKEGDKPLCKSLNFTIGRPDEPRFPWGESGFDTRSEELPCGACHLKEWGTAPDGKTPWCSEQHTYPLLMNVAEGQWAPALFTVQRTGIKPSKTYLSSFARTKTPLYTVVTTLRLTSQKRGTVTYAVPTFAKGGATDTSEWPYYAQQYRSIRDFIQTPKEEEVEPAVSTPAPATASAAATAAMDDDVPF